MSVSRVQSVSRLLYKAPVWSKANPRPIFPRSCRNARTMVKRRTDLTLDDATVTVESMNLKKARGVKADGAWRYKDGIIPRMAVRTIDGKEYKDEKDPSQNRRKIESNFFITLNTNKSLRDHGSVAVVPAEAALAKQAVASTLEYLAQESSMCTYFKFGPKSSWYQDDVFAHVVQSVECH